jgi:hypothetical protein
MIASIQLSCRLIIAAILLVVTIPATMAGSFLELPDGIYYYRFVSSVHTSEATWINPAALSDKGSVTIQLLSEISDKKSGKNWGINVTGEGIGIAYRYLQNVSEKDYREFIFAAGKEMGNFLRLGGAYRYVSSGPDFYEKKHFWSLGLLFAPRSQFSYGAVWRNLNRSRISGEETDIKHEYSLTYSVSREVSFSVAMQLYSSQKLSDAVYTFGLDIHPTKKMTVYLVKPDIDGFEIGIRLNINEYFLGGQSRFGEDNKHGATSIFGGYSINKDKKR